MPTVISWHVASSGAQDTPAPIADAASPVCRAPLIHSDAMPERPARSDGDALPRRAARVRRPRARRASTSPATRAAPAADPGLLRGVRRARAATGHPGAHAGHRRRPGADAVPAGAGAGRRGLGRAPHLVPDQRRLAGQPRRLPGARAVAASAWSCSATSTRARSTGWCCRACARRSSRPSSTPSCGIAHCLTPEALDAALAGDARARSARCVVSPTYFGAVADVRGAGRGRARARRAARRRRGVGRAPRLPRGACPSTRSRRAPTSSCRARTRSSAASRSRRCCTSAPTRRAGSTSTSSTAR